MVAFFYLLVSNIVVLFGLNKLILGFSPSLGEKRGEKHGFFPFFPFTRVKKKKKVPEVFPPQPWAGT